ncbi:DUF982 domain-containing protein [Mesorhizobium sp. M7A.F.Ca.US.008.03.1.1]|nr:DUF982 domain-containing protein [Mesorhizobium sp. M7A.F.Ca.US.008.03.1.1]
MSRVRIWEGCLQDQRFEKPVRVALGRSRNTVYTVDRVVQAADILFNRWPAMTGKNMSLHEKPASAFSRGSKRPRDARKAFVEAAKEADILVERNP